MLKKERSRSPRKRMAGICPVMRGQAAGTDARAETARARGGRRKAQAQRYWGPVGQALRAAGARKGGAEGTAGDSGSGGTP